METTEQELWQAKSNWLPTLRDEVERCLRDGDDVEGLRALVALRGYALGAVAEDGLLICQWGLQGVIWYGALQCLREILYNMYGVLLRYAFERLSAEVSLYNLPR